MSSYLDWYRRWTALATYTGASAPAERIEAVVKLWHQPVPGDWKRHEAGSRIATKRYTRGNFEQVLRGEHQIEFDLLVNDLTDIKCSRWSIIDGVNAVPFATDAGGGRAGNVEADIALLVKDGASYRLMIVEVKVASNDAWYAVVENLRQLRLARETPWLRTLFATRSPDITLPTPIRIDGAVLAPPAFYSTPRKKANALPAAEALVRRFARERVHVHLATWHTGTRSLEALAASAGSTGKFSATN